MLLHLHPFLLFLLTLALSLRADALGLQNRPHCDRGFNYPGKVHQHTFEISYITGAPDGVKVNHVLGVNGQSPGPTLEGIMYDRLVVRVINKIQDGQNLSIHWHGIQQRGTPFEDGPAQIMQCPIKYGSYQVYNFELDRPGTYWYHSHVLSQYTEGLWGVLIVHNNHEVYCTRYEEEFTIALSDWYHHPAKENENWHLSPASGGAPPYPDSILLNGKGRYPCDIAAEKRPICDPSKQLRQTFQLSENKKYRIRIINVSGFVTFNVTIDGHMFEVIEVDGVDVGRIFLTEALSFGPGQRYSIIMHRLRDVTGTQFLFRAKARTNAVFMFRSPTIPNINRHPEALEKFDEVTALFDFSLSDRNKVQMFWNRFDYTQQLPSNPRNKITFLDDLSLSPYRRNDAPSKIDREFPFNISFYNDPVTKRRHGAFDFKPYVPTGGKPLLAKMLLGDPLPDSARPIRIGHREVIQLVVNNPFGGTHQLHLHGHHFWVISKGHVGAGPFDPTRHKTYELGAAQRDTVAIKEKSYVVIRFIADNPGLWTFHCHIDWHNLSGMAVNFIEAEDVARQRLNITSEARRVCADHGVYI